MYTGLTFIKRCRAVAIAGVVAPTEKWGHKSGTGVPERAMGYDTAGACTACAWRPPGTRNEWPVFKDSPCPKCTQLQMQSRSSLLPQATHQPPRHALISPPSALSRRCRQSEIASPRAMHAGPSCSFRGSTLASLYETALHHARCNEFEAAREYFCLLTRAYPNACKCWVSWAQVRWA